MHYHFDSIHDAAKAIEDASSYLRLEGDTVGNEVCIDVEYFENGVDIMFTKRDSIINGNTVLVWRVEVKKKTLDLPDLTATGLPKFGRGTTSHEQLKKLYSLLSLGVTGGKITKDSLLHAAEKFDEK